MRSQVILATAVEGIRSYPAETLESERLRRVPMWRRRALDPDAEGVSARFRFAAVDMTGRLVVRP